MPELYGINIYFKIFGKKFCIFKSSYYFYSMIAMKLSKKLLKMNTQVSKTLYDGQKFISLGDHYKSLESAHSEHRQYSTQLTFEDIENLPTSTPYLHLMEFRNDEHYNDLYFIWPSKIAE